MAIGPYDGAIMTILPTCWRLMAGVSLFVFAGSAADSADFVATPHPAIAPTPAVETPALTASIVQLFSRQSAYLLSGAEDAAEEKAEQEAEDDTEEQAADDAENDASEEAEDAAEDAAEEEADLKAEAEVAKEAQREAENQAEDEAEEEAETAAEQESENASEDEANDAAEEEAEAAAEAAAEQQVEEEAEIAVERAAEDVAAAVAENIAEEAVEVEIALVVASEVEGQASEEAETQAELAAEYAAQLSAEEEAEAAADAAATLAAEKEATDQAEEQAEAAVEQVALQLAEDAATDSAEAAATQLAEEEATEQAEHQADESAELVAQQVGEAEAEEASERAAEEQAEQAALRRAEQAAEEEAQRAAERAAERNTVRRMERLAEEEVEKTAEQVAERRALRRTRRIAEDEVEREVERAAEREARHRIRRMAEQEVERAAERQAERSIEAARERMERRVSERAEAVAGRLEEQVEDKLDPKNPGRSEAQGPEAEIEREAEMLAFAFFEEVEASIEREFIEPFDEDEALFVPEDILLLMSSEDASSLDVPEIETQETIVLKGLGMILVRARLGDGIGYSQGVESVKASVSGATVDRNHLYESEAAPAGGLNPHTLAGLVGATGVATPTVRIGLIDTMVDTGHRAFAASHIRLKDFVSHGIPRPDAHGTAVAAIMVGDDPGQFQGLVPHAELYAASVFSEPSPGRQVATAESLVRALDWLVLNDVPVINMSLSGPQNELLSLAIQQVSRLGSRVVAAVGNEGPYAKPLYPAAYPDVVAVTAIDEGRRVYMRANRGKHIDFAAPGVDVMSAQAGGGYGRWSGTSIAAPFVTTVLALQVSGGDDRNLLQAVTELQASAEDLGRPGHDKIYGHGLIRLTTVRKEGE